MGDESNFELNYDKKYYWILKTKKKLEKEYFPKNEKIIVSGQISKQWKSPLQIWKLNSLDKKRKH